MALLALGQQCLAVGSDGAEFSNKEHDNFIYQRGTFFSSPREKKNHY